MEIELLKEKIIEIIPSKYKLIEFSNSGRDGYLKFGNFLGNKILYTYFSPYKDIEIVNTFFLKKKHLSYKEKYKVREDSFSYEDAINKLIINKEI